MSFIGISLFNFIVKACECERIAPILTHIPSIGIIGLDPRILFVSACPFHSSRVCPSSTKRSIQGINEPARGAPNSLIGMSLLLILLLTLRSISRIECEGSFTSFITDL